MMCCMFILLYATHRYAFTFTIYSSQCTLNQMILSHCEDEVCIPQTLTNPSSSTTSLNTEAPPLPTQPAKENPKDEGPINRSDTAIPSYMLTPVSSIGTPTITLEGGEPTLSSVQAMPKEAGFKSSQEESLSESPLPSGLLHPQMRTPKVDPTVGAQHNIFKLLPEALDPGSVTTTTTRGLSSSSKSQVSHLFFALHIAVQWG